MNSYSHICYRLVFFFCLYFVMCPRHYSIIVIFFSLYSFYVQGFDALLASLDVRGIRESYLHMMLQRIEMSFKESVRRNALNGNTRMQNGDAVKRLKSEGLEMARNQDSSANMHSPTSRCIENLDALETSTSFVVQLGRNEADSKDTFMRYLDFEKWMQKECLHSSILCAMKVGKKRCNQLLAMCDLCHDVYFSGGIPCPSCCMTHSGGKLKIRSDYFHVSSSSPLRMRMLKVLLSIVEVTTYLIFLLYDLWSS